MPSRIQELLLGRDQEINYEELIKKYPWVIEKNHKCILSPDSDGLLCGLLLSSFLDWKVKGFYDGKVLILEKGISAKDCIFLDMEIFRKEIKSFGHHMVLFNKNKKPSNWYNFENCGDIFEEEIKIIKPTHILFLTNRDYDDIIKKMNFGYSKKSHEDIIYSKKRWHRAFYKNGKIEMQFLRIRHPGRAPKRLRLQNIVTDWVNNSQNI